MLAVIYKKPKFLKTLQYVLGKVGAAIIRKNITGEEPHILNKQFTDSLKTNRKVKRHCAHLILSLPKHESVDDLTMGSIAGEVLESMGYRNPNDITQNVPFVVVRHQDKEHEHIHIVASRVKFDGSCVSDSWDYLKAQNATRAIAASYNLSVTPVSSKAIARLLSQNSRVEATVSYNRSKNIRQLNANHTEPSFKETIGKAISSALLSSTNVTEYASTLYEDGVVARAKFNGTELLGFSYAYRGKYVAGNQISRRYSWNNIQAQWELEYNPILDYEPLKQVGDVALKYKGEELPSRAIARNLVQVEAQSAISPHAQLYAEMKAMLKKKPKVRQEQVYPDISTPMEDEVKELRERLGQDSKTPKAKQNKDIELD